MTTSSQGTAQFNEAGNSLSFLHAKRQQEFLATFSGHDKDFLKQCSVLEIGSGTGYQLTLLKEIFGSAKGIDLENSRLRNHKTDDVTTYDGHNIPFADSTFDFVYSSNVMEHVPHLDKMNSEVSRILKPGGTALHLMPTHSWRFWTIVSGFLSIPARVLAKLNKKSKNQTKPKSIESGTKVKPVLQQNGPSTGRVLKNILLPPRHGERGNSLTEIYYFHPRWWLNQFKNQTSIVVSEHRPTGIFYTGWGLLNSRLSWSARARLSKFLGSACHIYNLQKNSRPTTTDQE